MFWLLSEPVSHAALFEHSKYPILLSNMFTQRKRGEKVRFLIFTSNVYNIADENGQKKGSFILSWLKNA